MSLTKYYPYGTMYYMTQNECSRPGCHRPVAVKVAALCLSHYQVKVRSETKRQCSLPWCERKLYAKGLCDTHYNAQREGRPLVDPNTPKPECSFEGCGRECLGNQDVCKTHYIQRYHGKSLTPIVPRRTDPSHPGERNCKKCGVWKSVDDFYDGSRPGQKQSKCKECYREDVKAARLAKLAS